MEQLLFFYLTVVDEVAVVNLGVHALRRVAAVGGGDEPDALVVVVGCRVAHRLPLHTLQTFRNDISIIRILIHIHTYTGTK